MRLEIQTLIDDKTDQAEYEYTKFLLNHPALKDVPASFVKEAVNRLVTEVSGVAYAVDYKNTVYFESLMKEKEKA